MQEEHRDDSADECVRKGQQDDEHFRQGSERHEQQDKDQSHCQRHGNRQRGERPLAIVMIGGLITSTLFTLLALPTFYSLVMNRAVLLRRTTQ